jgi:tryptophan 2,3-dioxygenase
MLAQNLLLPDEILEALRAHAQRKRCRLRQPFVSRVREEISHGPKYASRVTSSDTTETPLGHGTGTASDDEYAPILAGQGASDYERYLRTDELLSLQKTPEEMAHRDELLFQTVHQSSELWLKLAWFEVETAIRYLRERKLVAAIRLLRRATDAVKTTTGLLDMLEQMSPWEYTKGIRPVLGHGSGFDSPGWNGVRRVSPDLGSVFHELRREAGLSLVEVYTRGREHEELYQLAELLTEWDERATLWRIRHFKVVERIIGGEVVGTQGTPVELLGGLIGHRFYPELWDVRNELTELAKKEE